jgi:hypothetical protein
MVASDAAPGKIRSNVPLNEISTHAFRHFHRQFRDAKEENWDKTDDGYIVWFTENAHRNQAYYDRRGSFLYTLKYMAGPDVPNDLRERVNHRYPGYSINVVTEVNTGDKIVYLVNMIGDHCIQTVSVHDGMMEVVDNKAVDKRSW